MGSMKKAEMRGAVVGECGEMWSRHTFSQACLEPTRTGVGSPGAKMHSEVRVSKQEPED